MTKRTELRTWGPAVREADVLLYSIGSLDEAHGPALPRSIDDHLAIRWAADIADRTGFRFRKHLPYVSDRVGEIARDWCPLWMPPDELIRSVGDDLRGDVARWPRPVSHVILINGHGGNNFLKEHEKALSRSVGRPVLVVLPLEGGGIRHPRYGHVRCSHADTAEHSLAAFLGLLDQARLKTVNAVAAKDPRAALTRWKPLAGLGWYVLYGGPRYEALRNPEYGLLRTAEEFLSHPVILGDPDIGRRFYAEHLGRALRSIRRFIARPPASRPDLRRHRSRQAGQAPARFERSPRVHPRWRKGRDGPGADAGRLGLWVDRGRLERPGMPRAKVRRPARRRAAPRPSGTPSAGRTCDPTVQRRAKTKLVGRSVSPAPPRVRIKMRRKF